MTTFPGSPHLLKGGIALLDPQNGTVLRIIPLQYSSDTLMRTLQVLSLAAMNMIGLQCAMTERKDFI